MSAERIERKLPPLDGTPIEELPDGLLGRATTGAPTLPARASRVLSGMLAVEGRVLLVTITSEDLEWARHVWLSIRRHSAWLPPRRERRAGKRKQGRCR